MKSVRPSWERGVVLVCKKCEGNGRGDLRSELKDRVKREGLKPQVRVVSSGCLDICPKDRVTVMVCPRAALPRMFVVGREDERRELADEVVRLGRSD